MFTAHRANRIDVKRAMAKSHQLIDNIQRWKYNTVKS